MSDYREAIQNPSVAFKNSKLQNAIVKQTPLGLPYLVSGGFALTARLETRTNGISTPWAIRFFHKEVRDLQDRYSYISRFLQNKDDDFFVKFQYEAEGIRVREKWYPIVKMDWVEGKSLSEYIQYNINNPRVLKNLAKKVQVISQRLSELKMAHGDIQHGNLLVRNDEIVLIDYDGMFVPGMPYKNSNETGHVAFQHPQRDSSIFNERIDRFSSIIIYVSLVSLALDSGQNIWETYHTGENLIFGKRDYQDPSNSSVFCQLINSNISEVRSLVTRLQQICKCHIDDVPTLNDFLNNSINLSSLRNVSVLNSSLNSTNEIPVLLALAKKSLFLDKEGEKITVVGKVAKTHYHDGKVFFIHFDTNWNSFATVIFLEGLENLMRVRNKTEHKLIDELKEWKGKYLKVTGIVELYTSERNQITKRPQIIVQDPYQIKGNISESDAFDILNSCPKKDTPQEKGIFEIYTDEKSEVAKPKVIVKDFLNPASITKPDPILNTSTKGNVLPKKPTPPATRSYTGKQTINTGPHPSAQKQIPPKPTPPRQQTPANANPIQNKSPSVSPSSSTPPKPTLKSNPLVEFFKNLFRF